MKHFRITLFCMIGALTIVGFFLMKKESAIAISFPGKPSSPAIIQQKQGYLLASILQKKERFATKKWRSKERPTQYSIVLTTLDNHLKPNHAWQLLVPKEPSGVPLFYLRDVALATREEETWLYYSDESSTYAAPLYHYEDKWVLGTPTMENQVPTSSCDIKCSVVGKKITTRTLAQNTG